MKFRDNNAFLLPFFPFYSDKISDGLSCNQSDDFTKSFNQRNNAVTLSLSYAECYPGIDILHLIPVLDELQSLIVELAHRKYVATSFEVKFIAALH